VCSLPSHSLSINLLSRHSVETQTEEHHRRSPQANLQVHRPHKSPSQRRARRVSLPRGPTASSGSGGCRNVLMPRRSLVPIFSMWMPKHFSAFPKHRSRYIHLVTFLMRTPLALLSHLFALSLSFSLAWTRVCSLLLSLSLSCGLAISLLMDVSFNVRDILAISAQPWWFHCAHTRHRSAK
jgi:hypothetical protein